MAQEARGPKSGRGLIAVNSCERAGFIGQGNLERFTGNHIAYRALSGRPRSARLAYWPLATFPKKLFRRMLAHQLDELVARMDVELLVQVFLMEAHGTFGDDELVGNVGAREPLHGQEGDLALAWGEAVF